MKNQRAKKTNMKERRTLRVRKELKGGEGKLRLSVFRSLRYISAQLIDLQKEKTVASIHSKALLLKGTKQEIAFQTGKLFGEALNAQGVKSIVFDRNGYKYHGRVKAFAEGLRGAGVIF